MNVEDSYEGAVRRLRRLGHAGVDLAPQTDQRVCDLEELATLACDENERLGQELDQARDEIDRLRRLVATLQETLSSGQSEESFTGAKPRGRGAAFYFVMLVIFGGGGAALFAFRPWEQFQGGLASSVTAAPVVQPSVPVVTAPPPPAPPPPVIPKVEPTIPKVAPVVAAPAPAKIKPHRQHAPKHHKRASASHSNHPSKPARTDDPLGGLSL